MPTYDFKCDKCSSTVEMRTVTYDSPNPVCVECGGTMSKVWTPPSVHFRGGGWGGQG